MNNNANISSFKDFQIRAKNYEIQSKWVTDNKINNVPYIFFKKKNNLGNILDVGGGTGFLSQYLSDKIPYTSITIVDSSTNMLKKAKERIPHATTVNSSIESYCNSNFQKFETIIVRQILHYVDDVNVIISLLKEKISNDGIIYIGQFVVPDKESDKWHENFIKKISKNRKRSFIYNSFLDIFLQNGFEIVKVETNDYEENIQNFYKRKINSKISYEDLLKESKETLNDRIIKKLKIRTVNNNLFFTVQFCHLFLSRKNL